MGGEAAADIDKAMDDGVTPLYIASCKAMWMW